MKKIFLFCLVVAMALGFSNAYAGPSAKATAQLGDLSVLYVSGSGGAGVPGSGGTDPSWTTLFTQDIKTPNGKELFINVSLEAGLTTDTTVMSKKLEQAIAEAEAVIEVRVMVDGIPVPVNEKGDSDITFARRTQTLKAEFAGDISGCLTLTDQGIVVDWTCITPEKLQLILDTMQANSFNFIAPNLSAGQHTVKVQAKLYYRAYGNLVVQETIDDALETMAQGDAFAKAYLGNGSVTVEVVRMIKGEDLVVDLSL